MRTTSMLRVAAAVAASAIAAGVSAQTSSTTTGLAANLYAGVTVGQSHAENTCRGLSDCEDSDTALRLLGGYQFNRNLAAEVGYHNLGSVKATGAAVKANAWEAVALGIWPVGNRLGVYGKLGAYRGEVKGSGSLLGAGQNNGGLTYGVGAQLGLTPRFALRGEWQNYSGIGGGGAIPKTDIRVVSVGAIFRFQ